MGEYAVCMISPMREGYDKRYAKYSFQSLEPVSLIVESRQAC